MLENAFSLQAECKRRFLTSISGLKIKSDKNYNFVLLLDEKTFNIVSSLFKRIDLLDYDIISIDRIENKNRPEFKHFPAIYYLSGKKALEGLHGDFKIESISKKKTKTFNRYQTAHVYLANLIKEPWMQSIAKNIPLIQHIQTFKELNYDFISILDNEFSFDMRSIHPLLYCQKGTDRWNKKVQKIAHKLATVIFTCSECPEVQIVYNQHKNEISEKIAEALKDRVQKIQSDMWHGPSDEQKTSNDKITVLILDRSLDVTAPLLRDFHYLPAIYDLLTVQNNIVTFSDNPNTQGGQDKTPGTQLQISEADDTLRKYKHCPLPEVMESLPREFNSFIATNQTAKATKANANLDLDEMSAVLKDLPQFQETIQRFRAHLKSIEECKSLISVKSLFQIGELEQKLATGIDSDGKESQSTQILQQIEQELEKTSLNEIDKLRLVALALNCMKLSGEDHVILTSTAPIDLPTLKNLMWFDVNVQPDFAIQKSALKVSEAEIQLAKQRYKRNKYGHDNHTSILEFLLDNYYKKRTWPSGFVIANSIKPNAVVELNEDMVDVVSPSGKGRNAAFEMDTGEIKHLSANKLIVFIAGGVSYSEIRRIRRMSQGKQIVTIIGGTDYLTPESFLSYVKDISSELAKDVSR